MKKRNYLMSWLERHLTNSTSFLKYSMPLLSGDIRRWCSHSLIICDMLLMASSRLLLITFLPPLEANSALSPVMSTSWSRMLFSSSSRSCLYADQFSLSRLIITLPNSFCEFTNNRERKNIFHTDARFVFVV